MNTSDELKNTVKEKYGKIALKVVDKEKPCCCGSKEPAGDYSVFADDYSMKDGYVQDADLQLGCGVPTDVAEIKTGDTVVDLGSGAGNDVFVARTLVGENGKVVGIDFTEEMHKKANNNKQKLGFENVEFKLGDIEDTPLENNFADVVISNCVLNLVPSKEQAFAEIYRILKPGAHFSVSDIVLKGELPEELRKSAEMYAGCVSGAIQQDEYIGIIKKAGFENVEIKKTKLIELPDSLLIKYLDNKELHLFKQSDIGIFSITVNGYKKL